MPSYEWTGDGVYRDHRNGQELDPGDVAELPEHVGEPQPELVRAEDSEAEESTETTEAEVLESEAESESAPDRELDPHPDDLTVAAIEDRVAEIDDADALEAIREAEADGQDRTTAIDAIESRLDELTE